MMKFSVITLATILSMSVFANAYASDDSQSAEYARSGHSAKKASGSNSDPQPLHNAGVHTFKTPSGDTVGVAESGGIKSAPHNVVDNAVGSGPHHKIKTIKKLFRSNGNSVDDGSSVLANIPVIQPLTPAQINGTSTTATVTIPVCDGIVPGPCLDKTT